MTSAPAQLCAAVVLYGPDESVLPNVAAMVAECGRVLALDNGSSAEFRAKVDALPGVERIDLGGNRGIGTALNVAARRARELGCPWLVTFDQDSAPRPGFAAALLATAGRFPNARLVVPRIVEPGRGPGSYRWLQRHPRWSWGYRRVVVEKADVPGISMAVTSGSLTHLGAWESVGGFDENLFIDYIDIDYALRIRRAGGDIVVSAAAELEHRLGARQSRKVLGHDFRPTFHAAFRHYYMARNRVLVWRRHARAVPHWALFDLHYALYNAVRVLAFEPDKVRRLRAMLTGTWDGWRGRSGPCPEPRRRSFA